MQRNVSVMAGVVMLGVAVSAWAGSQEASGLTTNCAGGDAAGQPVAPRPPRFEPHATGFAGAQGFAVAGCFPDACPEPVKVTETTTGCKVADDLTPCQSRVMENFGLQFVHVQHPPLTPEECATLAEGKDEQTCADLSNKQRKFREVKQELRLMCNVGTGFFAVDRFELAANESGGAGSKCTKIGDATVKAAGWKPWQQALAPVKLTAQLRPITAAAGSDAVGTLELSFNRHQMRPCAFGWVRMTGKAPLWVMATANWAGGQGCRPAWHRYMPQGQEDGEVWREQVERPQTPTQPTAQPTCAPSATPPAPPVRPVQPAGQPTPPPAQPTRGPAPTAQPTPPPAPTTQPTRGPAPTAQPTPPPAPTAQPTRGPAPTAQPTRSPAPTAQPNTTPPAQSGNNANCPPAGSGSSTGATTPNSGGSGPIRVLPGARR